MTHTWQHRLVQKILRVSSSLHAHKEKLAHQESGVALKEGMIVICLELWLYLLSLPAYFFVHREVLVSAFAERPDDVVQYRLRNGLLSSRLTDKTKNTK